MFLYVYSTDAVQCQSAVCDRRCRPGVFLIWHYGNMMVEEVPINLDIILLEIPIANLFNGSWSSRGFVTFLPIWHRQSSYALDASSMDQLASQSV